MKPSLNAVPLLSLCPIMILTEKRLRVLNSIEFLLILKQCLKWPAVEFSSCLVRCSGGRSTQSVKRCT